MPAYELFEQRPGRSSNSGLEVRRWGKAGTMSLVIKSDRRNIYFAVYCFKFDLPFSQTIGFLKDCIKAIVSGKLMQRHEEGIPINMLERVGSYGTASHSD